MSGRDIAAGARTESRRAPAIAGSSSARGEPRSGAMNFGACRPMDTPESRSLRSQVFILTSDFCLPNSMSRRDIAAGARAV